MEIPMPKLTDTNSSSCPQPHNATIAVWSCRRTSKAEQHARPWTSCSARRDDDNGPLALRITKQGLEAVGVKDAAAADIKEPSDAHGLR
jgi:hypothetical protein